MERTHLLLFGALVFFFSKDLMSNLGDKFFEGQNAPAVLDVDQGRSLGGNTHVAFCTS